LTNPYNKDAFVATYDSAGVLLNTRRFGGVHDDGGSGIAYDRKDNLYVAGVFQQGTINVEGHTLTGEKPFNLFVLKFRERSREEHRKPATAAELAWVKKADGPGQESFAFENNPLMAVTPRGTVLVTGAYRDVAVFDAITLHSAGEEDLFLAQLSAGRDNDDDCDGWGCREQDDD
jgi:hypothetical protein